MKSKLSIALPETLVAAIDREVGRGGNRSALVAEAVGEYLVRRARRRRDRADLKLLNDYAAALNRETAEVLEYQAELKAES